ncbi:MAG TPA: cytochrome P460 family protein [Gemmataceae bacterium]|nr:cytochrome P460 family protein [Gemmataceae bacterium]
MQKWLGLLLISAAANVACLAASAQPTSAPQVRSADPQYDAKGDLKRPADFRTWVFVGANIGLRYHKDLPDTTPREQDLGRKAEPGEFHNVYIRPEAYEHYLKTGKFPDLTVLVMEVFEAKERDAKGIVSKGFFPGAHRRVEVAVKNGKRPDGSKTDWAYYDFDTPQKATASAFRDATCYDCHLKHADVDNVWVQFYPTLRPQGDTPR